MTPSFLSSIQIANLDKQHDKNDQEELNKLEADESEIKSGSTGYWPVVFIICSVLMVGVVIVGLIGKYMKWDYCWSQ